MNKSTVRALVERDKIRAVEVTSPLPPDECVRRLARVTTTRREGWYLDPRTATLPDPVFHGTVEPSRIRIALFADVLRRREAPVWFDVRVDPGPDGGTVLAGTAGSRFAPAHVVVSLVFTAVLAGLAVFFFVLGVIITASGHFNLAVGVAIGVPVIAAFSLSCVATRGEITVEGEGRVPPLLRGVCSTLGAASMSSESRPGAGTPPS